MQQHFYAHGKLLLTGEYFILDGAKGLAVPTRLGQRLTVTPFLSSNEVHWISHDNEGNLWLEGVWNTVSKQWNHINDIASGEILSKIFLNIEAQGFAFPGGKLLAFQLEFPRNWGLGSSSSLISLLSQYTGAEPYQILKASFGGSGYDIACASASKALIFQLENQTPKISEIDLHLPFREQMYFLHLGKKMNSREGIQQYRSIGKEKLEMIPELDIVTDKLLDCNDFDELEYLLGVHEAIVSRTLNLEKVKDLYFDDYWGAVKSLGAWGGDFVLLTSDDSEAETRKYFAEKGFSTLLSYDEMVL
jgi:mevalonate kinase